VPPMLADYPANRVELEAPLRAVAAVVFRQTTRLPKDVRPVVERLRELDRSLDMPVVSGDSTDEALMKRRIGVIQDELIQLQMFSGIVREMLAERQIGGSDA